jgi:hypothetical protein
VRKNVLIIQHQQEKKLSENENLFKQKNIAENIRSKTTKNNFLSATKLGKQTERKVLKT